jgi:hypothetical protein
MHTCIHVRLLHVHSSGTSIPQEEDRLEQYQSIVWDSTCLTSASHSKLTSHSSLAFSPRRLWILVFFFPVLIMLRPTRFIKSKRICHYPSGIRARNIDFNQRMRWMLPNKLPDKVGVIVVNVFQYLEPPFDFVIDMEPSEKTPA